MATGNGRDNNLNMEWINSVGGMVRHGTRVNAWCDKCDARKVVDMDALLKALGPKGSLLDRRPPCWVAGCDGRVKFYASPGETTPFRPCVTVAGQIARTRRARDEIDRLKALRNG